MSSHESRLAKKYEPVKMFLSKGFCFRMGLALSLVSTCREKVNKVTKCALEMENVVAGVVAFRIYVIMLRTQILVDFFTN